MRNRHPQSPAVKRQGLDRRGFLRAGGLGVLGLNLTRLLESRTLAAPPAGLPPIRSCIVIFYYGGPSHLDTWDMKPEAPLEVRGEFQSIPTSVPGIQVCEHLPHSAQVMQHLAVVRSMHHPMRNHNAAAVEALCGRTPLGGDQELLADDGNAFPCYGSIVSRQMPPAEVPSHIALPHLMYNVVVLPGQNAGFLGAAYNPLQLTRDPNAPNFRVDELELPGDLSATRLEHRRSLLSLVDGQPERSEAEESMSVYQQRALELINSQRVRQAFEMTQESPAIRDRYGRHKLGQSLLLARRLVEAGVRVINVNDKIRNGQLANWDSHQDNFARLKNDLLPEADQSFAALISDLADRGLLDSTLVIGLAEFGRTPKINGSAGRDHWPDCYSVVLAGGGVRGGQLYGASDEIGGLPAADPVTPGDLAATLFWRFGLDPAAEMRDLTDWPFRLAEGHPLHRLFA